jgi:hypothetical protein
MCSSADCQLAISVVVSLGQVAIPGRRYNDDVALPPRQRPGYLRNHSAHINPITHQATL